MVRRLILSSLVSILFCTTICIGQEPVADQPDPLAQFDWMIGKWVSDEEPLEHDIPGIGKKGEMSRMHITVERTLGGKFLASSGVIHKNGKTAEEFRDLWGPSTASNNVHRWFFDAGGLMVEGEMTTEGDILTHHIKGDALTSKVLATNDNAEFQKLIEKLGLSKLRTRLKPFSSGSMTRRGALRFGTLRSEDSLCRLQDRTSSIFCERSNRMWLSFLRENLRIEQPQDSGE